MARNSRTNAMEALLRNPSSRKAFSEALRSPIGSTSRARAKRTFSVMNKLQTSYDGAGGPGMSMERYEQPQDMGSGYASAKLEPQSMVVFHKLPPMNVNFDGRPYPQKPKAATVDGTGGPGGVHDGEGGIGDWFGSALGTFQNAIGLKPPPATPAPSIMSGYNPVSQGMAIPNVAGALGNYFSNQWNQAAQRNTPPTPHDPLSRSNVEKHLLPFTSFQNTLGGRQMLDMFQGAFYPPTTPTKTGPFPTLQASVAGTQPAVQLGPQPYTPLLAPGTSAFKAPAPAYTPLLAPGTSAFKAPPPQGPLLSSGTSAFKNPPLPPPVYETHKGLIPRIPGAILGVGDFIDQTFTGGAQFIGQNALAAGQRVGIGLNRLIKNYSEDPNDPLSRSNVEKHLLPFTSFQNTLGGRQMSDMFQGAFYPPTTPTKTGPFPTLQASVAGTQPAVQLGPPAPPVQLGPPAPTQGGISNAPSFYSNLNGVTSTQRGTQTQGGSTPPKQSAGGITGGISAISGVGSSLGRFTASLVATERDPNQGEWTQVGPAIKGGVNSGYRALGKYQIMPNIHFASIGLDPNSEADVQKFLATPSLQEELYNKIIGNLSDRYGGDPVKVAAAYFGGDPAAQIVGTPAGDDPASGDGHFSVNQYVESVLGGTSSQTDTTGSSTGTPTDSAPGTGYANVQDAVTKALGKTGFAMGIMGDEDNPITGGKNLAQMQTENKTNVWKEFGIDALGREKNELKSAQNALPMALTDYIRSQDQYLNQTDQMINDYIEQHKNDQGNEAQNARYLNYLYTLRGSQNKRYIDYIGSAVAMNKIDLDRVTTEYSSTLKDATDALTSANDMTKETYVTYTKALTDMYEAVEKAPDTAQHYRLVESQILGNYANQAADAAKLKAQSDYLEMYPKMKNHLYDANGFAMDIDIVQELNKDPEIDSGIKLRIYNEAMSNTLKAPSGSKDANSQEIDKRSSAQQAFTNYAKLAGQGVNEKSMDLVELAIGYGDEIAATYGAVIGGAWGNDPSTVSKLKNLIGSLGKKGWFGGNATPDRAPFVESAKKQGIETAIASALYDQFAAYMSTSGAKAEDFVEAVLNNTQSQTNRVPWTDSELMSHLGQMYSSALFDKSLAQSGIQRNVDGSITILSAGSTTTI